MTPAVTVKIRDANGNMWRPAPPITMAIGTNPGAGTLSGTLSLNAVIGIASFTGSRSTRPGPGTPCGDQPIPDRRDQHVFQHPGGTAASRAFTGEPTGGTVSVPSPATRSYGAGSERQSVTAGQRSTRISAWR